LIRQLRYYLHEICAAAGIATRIVPHQLRHYAASRTMPRNQNERGSKACRMWGRPRTLMSRCGIVRRLNQSCFRNASSSSSG
jgi:hypothetical protein